MKAVISMSESEYWRYYEVIKNELYITITSFYTYVEIQNFAAENITNYKKINKSAEFWNIQLYGLQAAFFVALGRLFDSRVDSHSIYNLLAMTESHPEYFSKVSLAARKASVGIKSESLDGFLGTAWEPNAGDVVYLRAALAPCIQEFRSVYGPIRHKVFAHKGLQPKTQTDALFSKAEIKKIDEVLYSLHDLMEALWQLYHNGMKPDLGARAYDYRARIAATTRSVLSGLP
jgi:hypothetical protein